MWIASVAWAALVIGVINRANRSRHIPLVGFAMLADISLVLYLQFTRSAVQTVVGNKLTGLELVHVGFSTLAVVFYIPTIICGLSLLKGNEGIRKRHRMFALAAFVCRTMGFLFMFSMWKH